MRSLTCIVCPIGCALAVEEGPAASGGPAELTITGNRCPRGAAYAREEIRAPKRTVTATCAAAEAAPPRAASAQGRGLTAPRRVPVKSSVPCPREKINALLADIYKIKVTLPVKAGDRVIAGWRNTGLDIVCVRSMEE